MLSIVRLFDLASKAPPLDKGFVIVTCILGVIYGIIAMTIIKKCHKPESKKAIAVIAVLMLKPVNDCILILSTTALGWIMATVILASIAWRIFWNGGL